MNAHLGFRRPDVSLGAVTALLVLHTVLPGVPGPLGADRIVSWVHGSGAPTLVVPAIRR